MAKSADARDLKSLAARREGSSPSVPTRYLTDDVSLVPEGRKLSDVVAEFKPSAEFLKVAQSVVGEGDS